MKQTARQVGICVAALFIFCLVCRWTVFRTYYIHLPVDPADQRTFHPQAEEAGFFSFGESERQKQAIHIPVQPQRRGSAWVVIRDDDGDSLNMAHLHAGPFGGVYNDVDGSFTGDQAVLIAVTLFWLLTGGIMLRQFMLRRGAAFYSYASIYYSGFFLFALINFALMLWITVSRLRDPARYSMMTAYSVIKAASPQFMTLTLPLVVCFALAMIVSNVALLRHEKPRLNNALGIGVGLLLLLGEVAGNLLFFRDFSGSQLEARLLDTVMNVYATAFVYFECMLIGAIFCGVKAARHEPALDRDFIVILGCWFRPDGTLPPLLRGRVDRAIAFWKKQREATGKEAVLIPSGGQGRNEPMPEAEAMRNYLLQQGIPENRIQAEDQSLNTYQNMTNAKMIIEREMPQARVAFATTNYHVFRSGVWANQAGLKSEGMGSKTKWWFWPNAFMREVTALFQRRWKQEVIFLAALMAFFGLLSMILG